MSTANAVLVTRDRSGGVVRTPLRLDGLETDLNLQMAEKQTKHGIVRMPIRIQERHMVCTALYPSARAHDFEVQMARIIDHWAFNLNHGNGAPMSLEYSPGRLSDSSHQGGERTYHGFIQAFTRAYAWNDVLWRRDFAWRLLTGRDSGAVLSKNRLGAPYVPHLGDITTWGKAWYTTDQLRQLAAAKGARDGGNSAGNGSPGGPGGGGNKH